MRARLRPAPIALAALALVAGACGTAPPPRRLVVAVPAAPLSLLPNTINEEVTLAVQSNVFETLVDVDPGLGLRPGLAESWATMDDLTWVFRLRRGVLRHDGRPLHAADVAASLDHARFDPASRRRLQLAPVSSVAARDERTLLVRTRRPFDLLPSRLANVFVWAPGEGGAPVGTGPYRVRSEPGAAVRLTAFDRHRDAPLAVSEVEFRVLEPAQQVPELLAGRVHLLLDVRRQDVAPLRAHPAVRVVTRPGLRIVFLAFDVHRARTPHVAPPAGPGSAPDGVWPPGGAPNPFLDRRVRRAVALAVDRPGLARAALGRQGEPIDELAAPLEWGGRAAPPVAPADAAQARRLLAEAGFGAGFRVGLDFMPRKYRSMDQVVERLKADLAAVGIGVVPRPAEPADLLRPLEQRELTCYLLGWISDLGDATISYEYLLHTPRGGFGVTNGGGYSSPRLDALILAAGTRLTPLQRRERLLEAARLVREDAPLVPLYRQFDVYAAARGLEFTPRLDRRVRAAEMAFRR